jgi:chromosomal replication initiation ATPase DnaA
VARQLRLKLRRANDYRRATFIVSPTNADAIRAIDGWPSWYGGCLALVGPPSSGKSHLARAWAASVGAAVITTDTAREVDLATLQGHPILLEDADRGVTDETLFHLINMAGQNGGGLLLTARLAPQSWPADLPDLRSRLNAMPVAELAAPDDVVLEGLLTNFFRDRNITPTDDLIPYLLRRIERSAASARDIVDRLDEASVADHRPVSRSLARQFFEIEGETLDITE